MGGYWGGISPAMRDAITADAKLLHTGGDNYEFIEATLQRIYRLGLAEGVWLNLQLTERMQARDADHAKAIKER